MLNLIFGLSIGFTGGFVLGIAYTIFVMIVVYDNR